MKKLSSDFLYYKSLIGLIVGPILIAAFINFFWKNNFPDNAVKVSYVILVIFTAIQWIRWSHCRKVYYDGNSIVLKSYFSNASLSILILEIANVKFVYNFSINKERKLIKLLFHSNGKSSYVYFFKNSDKASLDKLLEQIRL